MAESSTTEEEWEETLLMLQLPSKVTLKSTSEQETYCQILGVATDQPLIKVKNQMFAGKVSSTVGSHLLFEIDGEPGTAQARKNNIKEIFVCDKTMALQPVYLEPKKTDSGASVTGEGLGDKSLSICVSGSFSSTSSFLAFGGAINGVFLGGGFGTLKMVAENDDSDKVSQ